MGRLLDCFTKAVQGSKLEHIETEKFVAILVNPSSASSAALTHEPETASLLLPSCESQQEPTPQPSSLATVDLPPQAPCKYDWVPGQRWHALRCVAHNHSSFTTIFRFLSLGHDVLRDLDALRMLAGQAALDAEASSSTRKVVA
jgi:hypothetical protein